MRSTVIKMSSLREHIEKQEGSCNPTNEAPKGTTQNTRDEGLHVSRRVVVVAGVAMISMVATAAIVALLTYTPASGTPNSPGAATPARFQAGRRAARQQPISPLGIGPNVDINDRLYQITEHARLVVEERERQAARIKKEELSHQNYDNVHPDFEMVEIDLEKTVGHGSGPKVRSGHVITREGPAIPHKDFEQVEVTLEKQVEHDMVSRVVPNGESGVKSAEMDMRKSIKGEKSTNGKEKLKERNTKIEEEVNAIELTEKEEKESVVKSSDEKMREREIRKVMFEKEKTKQEVKEIIAKSLKARTGKEEQEKERAARSGEEELKEGEAKNEQKELTREEIKERIAKSMKAKKTIEIEEKESREEGESREEERKSREKDVRERESKNEQRELKKEVPERIGKSMNEESARLPTKRLENGNRVCETPECKQAASMILENMDRSVEPCQDFYQFACGGWIDKHPVSDYEATGTFRETSQMLDKRLHQILETPARKAVPTPLNDIRTFYKSCKDTDGMDAQGYTPLVKLLSMQGGWPIVMDDWENNDFSLNTAIISLRDLGVYPLLTVGVDLDMDNTSNRIIYVDSGTVPLGVGDTANLNNDLVYYYYTFMTSAAKLLREQLGSSVSDSDIENQVIDIIAFEIMFSRIVVIASDQITDHAWRTTVAGLQQATDDVVQDQFNWLAFMKEMFINTDVIITEKEPIFTTKGPFFSTFSNLLEVIDKRTLANAIGWWWVFLFQQETTYVMRDLSYQFLRNVTGQTRFLKRSADCLYQTNGNLGFALSREYIDQYMADTVKKEVTEMVEDIRKSFHLLLNTNTWMLPEDLKVAKEKLTAIDTFVAYPDWIMDDTKLTQAYEKINIISGDHVGNLHRIGNLYGINELTLLRQKPVNSFFYPPTIVNAFYSPQQNSITILGGILVFPFYTQNSLAALNYGSIGMIIGHEMTHAFDNTGRLFDKNGNLRQWWSDDTTEAYVENAVCFVTQYNGYHPPELVKACNNNSVNGYQTLGENTADNGGVREAYHAYKLYVERYGEEPRLPGLDEFSPNQLFYLGFANTWCAHNSPQVTMNQLDNDPHAPARFRVLGSLSNDEEFSKVWKCPAGSPMDNGPDRCLLW